jgi:hypothetical protein
MQTEKLHFRIGLAGTYWDKHPVYSVFVNNDCVVDHRQIQTATAVVTEEYKIVADDITYVEFDHEVVEGDIELKIRLENKQDSDVVENEDKTAIVKDMLLNIRSIEIDEIDLGNLVYSKSIFRGDDPNRPTLDNCVDLGWNGTWTLSFQSPFYIWLLENI